MKMMDPGHEKPLASKFPSLNWVIRRYEDESRAAWEVLQGARGGKLRADRLDAWLRERPWLADDNVWLEHMNEPTNAGILVTPQGRRAMDSFTAEYTRILFEQYGIRSMGFCYGVGHPEPHQAAESMKAGLQALKRYGGKWALHEYGWPYVMNGTEAREDGKLTGWHTMRFSRTLDALAAVGLGLSQLPGLHITEAGKDRLLTGVRGGWQDVDNNFKNYAAELGLYESAARAYGIVEGIYIYTATPNKDWWSYGIQEPDAEILAHYIATGRIQ